MEERDSYRMLLGMLDGVARGVYFGSPLLYNREVSFGYYGLIYLVSAPFGHSPHAFIAAMNVVSLLSAILFVVPFYLVVESLFDRSVAIAASIVLAVVPVWWNAGLYGHPIMPAMLVFFSSIALLAKDSGNRYPLVRRIVSLLLLAFALTIRFDLLLLSGALAAVIWFRFRRFNVVFREIAFYGIGAIVLFKAAQLTLPRVQDGPPPESIFALLERFHSVGRFSGQVKEMLRTAAVIMGQGFTPWLILIGFVGLILVLRGRNVPQILFTVCVVLPNVIFWIPNPYPARHYLQMSPALSVAAAVTTLWLVSLLRRPDLQPVLARLSGPVLAASIVTASLAFPHGPGSLHEFRSPFLSRFALDQDRLRNSQLGADLLSLRGSNRPVLVLCDSNLVAARMEMLAEGVRVQPHWYHAGDGTPILLHEVRYNGRTFFMLEQSWDRSEVQFLLDRLNIYPDTPVLIDPYNPVIAYPGGRLQARLEKTASGEELALAAARHDSATKLNGATPQVF